MENFDAGIYSEAKGEYTRQLTLFIVPSFHRFFMTCIDQAASEEPQSKKQLWKFQEIISQVPEWNMDKVQREIQKIINSVQCDYLEELVTAVFIAHTKVLTAIRIGNKNKRVQITIPKLEHFIHRALSECSRLLWSSAYLFHNELSPIEKQKNHRQIEQLLHEGVLQAIRGLLPVKNILKDYLAEPDGADDEKDDEKEEDEKEDEEEPVKESGKELVKEEVKEPAKEEVKEPVKEDIKEPVKEVKEETKEPPTLATTTIPETNLPVIQIPDSPVVSTIQTVVIETEPSVRFTDFDQVIQQRGGETRIGYVEKDRSDAALEELQMMDEDGESLSDFEDLEEGPLEPLDSEDYESLP